MERWYEEYKRKLITPAEAVQYIKSGFNIVQPLGAGETPALLEAMFTRKDELSNVTVHQMLPIRKFAYLQPGMEQHFKHNAWFTSGASRELVQQGLADVMPNFFHDAPRLMKEYLDIDIMMASVSPMDEHGYFSFGISVDYTSTAARKAKMVILEVNPNMPRTLGDSFIHISEVDWLVENDAAIPQLEPAPVSSKDLTIGQYIAELVEDGSTIQLGIGGIPNATAQCLIHKKDLGIHSEMISDGMMDLVNHGAVNGKRKSMHKGKLVGCFAFGSERLYKFLHNNPLVDMQPVSFVNDPYIIGKQYKPVSINAAMEVDLFGQCASESIGYVQFSGTGGQADFARGVLRAEGGKGFIAMTSAAKKDTISKIVPILRPGAIVTTGKNEIDHVVTEFGVAKLRGKTLGQRAKALISVAHPNFRPWLTEEAQKMKLI